jgi:hypothetical protein
VASEQEYEYHFIEYEYDLTAGLAGDQREVSEKVCHFQIILEISNGRRQHSLFPSMAFNPRLPIPLLITML